MKILGLVQVGCLALFAAGSVGAKGPVIVHEWGTFTSLQDERGAAIKGINIDDEPVPSFVYQYGIQVTAQYSKSQGTFGLPPYQDWIKGWRPADHDVTMRLETPVLYFYPPAGTPARAVPPLQVHVDFTGGVLSQYYPYAKIAGWPDSGFPMETRPLADITSSLEWKDVQLGSTGTPVPTGDKVWTTPRDVSAPLLEVPSPTYPGGGRMEMKPLAEHFLFYRGLGHLDSPIHVAPNGKGLPGPMQMTSLFNGGVEKIDAAWVVQIDLKGNCAWRKLRSNPHLFSEKKPLASSLDVPLHASVMIGGWLCFPNFSSAFTEIEPSFGDLNALKGSMQDALGKEGLYPDEATAMLKTWELSYFKSPGLRFFYIVPRAWVDKVLPLRVTGAPTEITRVMVGRIELITDAQEAVLARLAAGPCPDLQSVKKAAEIALKGLPKEQAEAFERGERPLSDLGFKIPRLLGDYLSLGRFRDALVVHEQAERPSPALARFIEENGLAPKAN